MPSIAEVNAETAPVVRTNAEVIDGVTVAKAAATAAKMTRADARAALAKAAKDAKDAAAKARELAAAAPKPVTARDAVRKIDGEILAAAGEIAVRIAEEYPEEMRSEILALVSNQLHHLASPKIGWPETSLPVPARSEWA